MTDNRRARADAPDDEQSRQESGDTLAHPGTTSRRGVGRKPVTRHAVKKAAQKAPQAVAAGRSARRNENTEEGTGKQSFSMPRETLRTVKELADAEGVSVSRWMTQAADERAARERRAAATRAYGLEYLAEYEAEHGEISAEAIAVARRALGLDDGQADAA